MEKNGSTMEQMKNILYKGNNLKDGFVEELIKNNIGLQVLTDTGWSNFEGLLIKGRRQVVRLQLTNSSVKTTLDHDIYTDRLEKKSVKQLRIKDKIYTKFGAQSVVSIKLLNEDSVYDLLNVHNNRRFFANDILCSNCEFVINDETLIAPIKLLELEGTEPVRKTGQVRWYKPINSQSIYVVSLDPSLGTGGDPAAIQVFDASTTEQVAEWKHNRTDVPTQIKILADIVRELSQATGKRDRIYYSIENNTLGEAALISLNEYGEDRIPGYFLSDNSVINTGGRRIRKGFNTTHKAKLTACNKFKILVESGRMKLYSRSLISELKNFVSSGASYAAKPGETDDLVMATLLAIRMMMQLQSYHLELDSHIRDHSDSIVEPLPFISILR